MRSWQVAWVLPVVAIVGCASGRTDDSPTASVVGAPAVPGPTVAPTAPVDTMSTPAVAPSIVEWLEAQRDAGRRQTLVDVDWSTEEAVIVTAFTQKPEVQGDVVLAFADGRTAPMPPAIRSLLPDPPTGAPILLMSRLGGDPLVVHVADDGRTIVASRIDPVTLTWTTVTGLTPLSAGERLHLYTAGNHALFVHWSDTFNGADEQWGEIVAPDGTVTTMTVPPPDTPMWFTNDAGGRAVLLGFDTVAGEAPDLRAPVVFDPHTNTWTMVPDPAWLSCPADGCVWQDRHEWPDPQFFRTTPSGVVATLPDGSYGLFDPVALTWRRLDDPPVALPGPIVSSVGDDRLVALPGPAPDNTQALGTAVWLDIAAGSWSAEQIVDLAGRTPPVWWEPRWWGDTLLLGADADEVGNPPLVAIDLTTGEVRAPSAEELTVWPALTGQVSIDELISAWQVRIERS